MKVIKGTSVALVMIFLFNMIGFQTSFAENASETDTMPQEQAETQSVEQIEDIQQSEYTAQPLPTIDALQENRSEDDTTVVEAEESPAPSAESLLENEEGIDIKEDNSIYLESDETIIEEGEMRNVQIYVTTPTGEKIPGAKISIGNNEAITNEDGLVVFDNINCGIDVISGIAPGYSSKKTAISVPNDNFDTYEFNLILNPSENLVEPMSLSTESDELSDEAHKYLDSFNYNEDGLIKVKSPYLDNDSIDESSPVAICNNNVYCFDEDNTYIYSLSTSEWSTAEPLPEWRTYAGIAVSDNKIYIIGGVIGYTGDGVMSNSVHVFDTTTCSWTKLASMPSSGAYFNAHVINGKIYAAGGVTSGNPLSTTPHASSGQIFYAYDIASNSWQWLNSQDNNISGAVSAAYGTKIYLVGTSGYIASNSSSILRIYDTLTNTWYIGQERPCQNLDDTGSMGGIFVNVSGCLYYQGGSSWFLGDDEDHPFTTEDTPLLYIPDTDEWVYVNENIYGNFKLDLSKYHPVCSGNNSLYFVKNYIQDNNKSSYIETVKLFNFDTYVDNNNKNVSVGESHIVCLKDGIVYTYGDNTYGQLGTGDNFSYYEFIASEAPWGDKRIVKVETRGNTTFALTEDNVLYGWGRNDKAQLGNGNLNDQNTPIQIMSDVNDVSAGYEHTIVLKTNGDVYGWGDNSYCQIGDSVDTVITSPYKIASYSSLIEAGDYHTFFNDGGKTLHGIGKNDHNQIGYPSEIDKPIQVSCGANHTVALDCNGKMYVWGSNEFGQLGSTVTANSVAHPYNTNLTASNVAAGANSTAFVSSGLYMVGDNNFTNTDYQKISGINNITDVSIGKKYSVAFDSNGNLWRFGRMTTNEFSNQSYSTTPIKVDYNYKITQIDSYRKQTLAIDEIGRVIAWGEGYYADGTDVMTVKSYPAVINGINNPIQVSRGKNHNLVLDYNGDVYGWGSNSNFPMGDLDGKVRTVTKLNNISDVKQIAAGTEYSLFLKNDGTLWGVGKNDVGQLAQNDMDKTNTPVQITTKNDFISVSAGEDFAIALAKDGVYTWGDNSYGQLGNGTNNSSVTPIKLDIALEDGESIIDIKTGLGYCLALTSIGNVYSWGKNSICQLGIGNKTNSNVPVKIPSLQNIKYIEAGYNQSFSISHTDSVSGWGSGKTGQLALSSLGSTSEPTEISSLTQMEIMHISGANGYTVMVDKEGNLYTVGSNESGGLGAYSDSAEFMDTNLVYDTSWLVDYMKQYSNVSGDVPLPTSGPEGSEIKWTSKDKYFLEDSGKVYRPKSYEGDADVILTAELIYNIPNVGEYTDVDLGSISSIIKSIDFNVHIQCDKNDSEIPDLPDRVYANSRDIEIISNDRYYEEPEDIDDSDDSVELASDPEFDQFGRGFYINNEPVKRGSKNYISVPSNKKLTAVVTNNTSESIAYPYIISDTQDQYDGWGHSYGIYMDYEKNYISNIVNRSYNNGIFNVLTDTLDGNNPDANMTCFTSDPDIYEPNQLEFEVGAIYTTNDDYINTNDLEKSQRFESFASKIGTHTISTEGIGNLSIDSDVDLDVYPIRDVKVGDKITVCVELDCSKEESDDFLLSITNNIHDTSIFREPNGKTSIEYNVMLYKCKSFEYTSENDNKQVVFATWVANRDGDAYINFGKEIEQLNLNARPINYKMTVTKISNSECRTNDYNELSYYTDTIYGWCTNDFIFLDDKVDITIPMQGNSNSGAIDNQLDIDWVSYQPEESGVKRISLEGNPYVALYADNEVLTYGKGLIWNMDASKKYYIGVYCPDGYYDRLKSNPKYTVTVSEAMPDELPEDIRDKATSLSVNKTVDGKINNGEIVYYRFTPSSTGSYKIYSPDNDKLMGNLYAPVGNYVNIFEMINSTVEMSEEYDFKLAYTLRANKTYYIAVTGKEDPNMDYSIRVEKYELPSDPLFTRQWGLMNTAGTGPDINILPAWEISKGEGVNVGVIDSGFDMTHEDLSANIDFSNSKIFTNDDAQNKGHGTHVAGIIAAPQNGIGVIGVAPEAKLTLFTIGTDSHKIDSEKAVTAINEVNNLGLKLVNCSFDIKEDKAKDMRNAITNANKTLFVFSAGNNGADLSNYNSYPSVLDLDNMIVVANATSNGIKDIDSNYGGPTDIAAPGNTIWSTFPTGNQYGDMTGTSMAAPMVTGIAALIMSKYPNESIAEVKERILNSNIRKLDNWTDKVQSGGIVDAYTALTVKPRTPEANAAELSESETPEEVKARISRIKAETPDEQKTTKICVNPKDGVSYDDIVNMLAGFEFEFSSKIELTGSYYLNFSSIDEADEAIDLLNSSDNINYAEPNYLITID